MYYVLPCKCVVLLSNILLLLLPYYSTTLDVRCQPPPQSPFSLCVQYIYNYSSQLNVHHLGTALGLLLNSAQSHFPISVLPSQHIADLIQCVLFFSSAVLSPGMGHMGVLELHCCWDQVLLSLSYLHGWL